MTISYQSMIEIWGSKRFELLPKAVEPREFVLFGRRRSHISPANSGKVQFRGNWTVGLTRGTHDKKGCRVRIMSILAGVCRVCVAAVLDIHLCLSDSSPAPTLFQHSARHRRPCTLERPGAAKVLRRFCLLSQVFAEQVPSVAIIYPPPLHPSLQVLLSYPDPPCFSDS